MTIDDRNLTANTPLTLGLSPVQHAPLRVASRGGSCSRTLSAAMVKTNAQLPSQDQVWASQLLYQTQFNNHSNWKGRSSLCRRYPEGRSWTELGTDKIYRLCDQHSRHLPDTQTMSMRAILPGTDIVLQTLQVKVDLNCPSSDPKSSKSKKVRQ